jgi:hypothetical protein
VTWQSFFRGAIRVVFLFAFIAFLSASISHIAVFYHNFEADKDNWISPYMLAVSIDLTALVLTVGVMFFRKGMPWYAVIITWVFIMGLTGFSWAVNWEYATTFQGNTLRISGFLSMLNPILASSFAFFNLVYSFVSEFFGMKQKTADELQAEATRLEALEEAQKRIDAYHERNKKASIIQRAKGVAIEIKEAAIEVKNGSAETAIEAEREEIEGNNSEGDLETSEFPEEETGNHLTTIKLVSIPEIPGETTKKPERDTDKLKPVNRKRSLSGNDSGNSSETTRRICGILKKKPYISVSELATKASVSKGYASKVRSQFLKEHELKV